jgi:hypothetical protein
MSFFWGLISKIDSQMISTIMRDPQPKPFRKMNLVKIGLSIVIDIFHI